MERPDRALPRVTVVIPLRDERTAIGPCLEAILAQDYPQDRMEILVADGRSTDGSRAIVESLRPRAPHLHLIDNPERIVPTALNRALRVAKGSVIVRVDARTVIAPDYVRTAVECQERTGADVVGGPMRPVGGGKTGDAIAAATSSRFGIGNAYFHYGRDEREADSVYMGVFRRPLFDAVGAFDEEMVCNQDDEFTYRTRRAGGRVVMSPGLRSLYQNRTTFRGLARQYARYGVYKVRVLQKHPQMMSWRHAVPPLFVAALAASVAAVPFGTPWSLAFPLLAAVYAAALAGAAVCVAREHGRWLLPGLLVTFPVIHLAWGTGVLWGLWRFRGRWREREWRRAVGRVPVAGRVTAP
jgi:cellulose synthase/poly-beta-1,6-N-acetylglucosamine synthase-like glycosyltransferase